MGAVGRFQLPNRPWARLQEVHVFPAWRGQGYTAREPADSNGQPAWGDHIGELQRIRAELTRAETNRVAGGVDVIWPTVLAHGVVHGAARHAQRRADEAGPGRGPAAEAARAALAAAQRSQRDFDAVDKDGRDAVWL